MTRSPAVKWSTSAPTASTMPAASCPSTVGTGYGNTPLAKCKSVPQMPDRTVRTRTSPGRGSASETSARTWGSPAAGRTAARAVMLTVRNLQRVGWSEPGQDVAERRTDLGHVGVGPHVGDLDQQGLPAGSGVVREGGRVGRGVGAVPQVWPPCGQYRAVVQQWGA